MPRLAVPLCLAALALARPAAAQNLITRNTTIRDHLCVGSDRAATESFSSTAAILKDPEPRLLFHDNSTTADDPKTDWRLIANSPYPNGEKFFGIGDRDAATVPFRILTDAAPDALTVTKDRRVGIGMSMPQSDLHIAGGCHASMPIEDAATSRAARGRLTLRNNGITFFTLKHASIADVDYSGRKRNFQHQAGRFRVTTRLGRAGGIEMSSTRHGDTPIKGSVFTGGSGNAGCDTVFAKDYPLMPIAKRAALMRDPGHLPNVSPTAETRPCDLTGLTTGLRNEQEHAHLCIAELHDGPAQQKARLERLETAPTRKAGSASIGMTAGAGEFHLRAATDFQAALGSIAATAVTGGATPLPFVPPTAGA